MTRPGSRASPVGPPTVRSVGFPDDPALVQALKKGHPGAPASLFDKYGLHIQRVLANVMGIDSELEDLLHEVFARALTNVDQLQDATRLKPWLTSIAVFTARSCIRAHNRRRWLGLAVFRQLELPRSLEVTVEVREAVQWTYRLLGRLSANQRIVFALRLIHQMELAEVAEVCNVSLATVKRRLSGAERRFVALASNQPALQSWLSEGSRWGTK